MTVPLSLTKGHLNSENAELPPCQKLKSPECSVQRITKGHSGLGCEGNFVCDGDAYFQ